MTREEIMQKYPKSGDNLIAILHDLQDNCEWNYLSKEDLQATADYLQFPYSFVHGVATFYTMFSLEPRGRNVIRICQSPPCHLMGASTISDELEKILGVGFGETTPDRQFTLEMTSCLGVCGVAPAMMINDQVYGNLNAERVKQIIDEKRREK
ncbi:MAG: NADH-quinone oxidoreductase subunit NuoE [Acidobacteriota bacterium]|jgi:NADH-quinone oxidoreductase E subunit|nr:NADH-quinone oxidoreductase subunit NuoE [Acidobacteriota bacterium]